MSVSLQTHCVASWKGTYCIFCAWSYALKGAHLDIGLKRLPESHLALWSSHLDIISLGVCLLQETPAINIIWIKLVICPFPLTGDYGLVFLAFHTLMHTILPSPYLPSMLLWQVSKLVSSKDAYICHVPSSLITVTEKLFWSIALQTCNLENLRDSLFLMTAMSDSNI